MLINKYEPDTENCIILYLVDNITSNVVAWIPGQNTVATINKYTIIKASPIDFEFQDNINIIMSHIPDFLTISPLPQESPTILAHQNHRNQKKNCAAFPPLGKLEKISGPWLLFLSYQYQR